MEKPGSQGKRELPAYYARVKWSQKATSLDLGKGAGPPDRLLTPISQPHLFCSSVARFLQAEAEVLPKIVLGVARVTYEQREDAHPTDLEGGYNDRDDACY